MAEQPASSPSLYSAPPSPGVSPVKLSDCIEDLIYFTISTYLQETPLDLGLSTDYCSRLLQLDKAHALPNLTTSHCRGVPVYPLYKHLARALERSITSGSFSRELHANDSIPVDELLAEKKRDWNELVAAEGSEILKMLEDVGFEMHVQEPFFSQLRAGVKTIEGRCAVGNYNRIAPGALLLFNKCLLLKVQHVNWYSSFLAMLKVESLANILPGVETIDEGVQVYRKFYAEEKELSYGVLAISVSKPTSQPYISLANLLSGLSYDGVGYLLGMMHTAGTVPSGLPPLRSDLVASSMKLHRPNLEVKGCILTSAARELAKHVSRSSEGWWGSFSGNDSDKNRLASEVIDRLLDGCCWMNVHFSQPHECVFEIRVAEGYGARWSADGAEFIGFLEPYTAEGYSIGWKH